LTGVTISARRIASTFITGWLTTGSAWHALTCRNTCPQGHSPVGTSDRGQRLVRCASLRHRGHPKIYAESFRSEDDLRAILREAQGILVYADVTGEQTSSASTIPSTLQQMSISFGVASASLAAAVFIPDRFHSSFGGAMVGAASDRTRWRADCVA